MDYGAQGLFPGGTERNQAYFRQWIGFDPSMIDINLNMLFDPQTSGGLLIAADPENAMDLYEALIASGEQASMIGEVEIGNGKITLVP